MKTSTVATYAEAQSDIEQYIEGRKSNGVPVGNMRVEHRIPAAHPRMYHHPVSDPGIGALPDLLVFVCDVPEMRISYTEGAACS